MEKRQPRSSAPAFTVADLVTVTDEGFLVNLSWSNIRRAVEEKLPYAIHYGRSAPRFSPVLAVERRLKAAEICWGEAMFLGAKWPWQCLLEPPAPRSGRPGREARRASTWHRAAVDRRLLAARRGHHFVGRRRAEPAQIIGVVRPKVAGRPNSIWEIRTVI